MKKSEIFKCILIGFFAGIVSGFFGAGGGLVLVPFMTICLKREEKLSRATTIFCIFFMVLTSSFFYFKKSFVDIYVAVKCIIGGILGSYLGTKLLYRLNNNILKILFIIFLIYSGIKMIIS